MTAFLDLIDNEEDKIKFEEIYNKNVNLLLYLAIEKLNGSVLDGEECVQEAFLYLARNFKRFRDFQDDEMKNYLITSALGFAVDKIRTETKLDTVSVEDIDKLPDKDSIDREFNKYTAVEISQVIDMLEESDRIYLYLTYVYGYKSQEISEMYSVKDSFVRKRIQLAKRKVVEILEKNSKG